MFICDVESCDDLKLRQRALRTVDSAGNRTFVAYSCNLHLCSEAVSVILAIDKDELEWTATVRTGNYSIVFLRVCSAVSCVTDFTSPILAG